MKKRLTKICSFVLLFAVLFSFSACGNSSQTQSTLREEFEDNGKDQPYSQQIPLTEMDFSVYEKYLSDSVAAIKSGLNEVETMELPCDIEYYESKDDKTPALILKKGTVVYTSIKLKPVYAAYGFHCWPDHEEGWRYGLPFKTEAEKQIYNKDDPQYYVKTDQLFTVVDEYMVLAYKDTSVSLTKDILNKGRKNTVLRFDISLYIHGAFCSPDMEKYYVKSEDIGVT